MVQYQSLSQRIGAELQAHIRGEFRALHQILQDEEARVLEQLRKEQEEELGKVLRHLQAAECGVRELEDNISVLKETSASTENTLLTEVTSQLIVFMNLSILRVHLV